MCGLVGIISRKPAGFYNADMELMQNLLLLDQIRGEDSTGVFSVMRDRNVAITKVGSHPMHLFTTTAWGKNRARTLSQGRMMIGHNRKATMGTINSANAHPFHENNIVLVHNGTLREDHKKLADREVDSHAVAASFATKGAEETIKELNAAFAFIWWDIEKAKLFAVRNDDRPLSMVFTDDLIILCSEPWMAHALITRSGKKVEKTLDLGPGDLHEYDLNGNYKVKKIELRKPVVHTNNVHQGGWTNQTDRSRYAGRDAFADMEDCDEGKCGGSTALVMGATTPTPFSSAASALVANAPFTKNEHYAKNDEVLAQVGEVSSILTEGKWKLTGSLVEPGLPSMDFVGYLPAGTSREQADKLRHGNCWVRIIGLNQSVCGPSAWVTGFTPVEVTKVHNTDIATPVWHYVVHNVKCKDCDMAIRHSDALFTSVTRRNNKEYRVSCADCVESKLTGEMQNVFTQRRLDALSDGQSVSEKPAGGALVLVETKGNATLH